MVLSRGRSFGSIGALPTPLLLRPQVGRAGYGTLEYILRLEVRKASKWNRRVAAAMTGLCLGGTAIMVVAAYVKCIPYRRGGEVRTALGTM
jgi:hypothetical protein